MAPARRLLGAWSGAARRICWIDSRAAACFSWLKSSKAWLQRHVKGAPLRTLRLYSVYGPWEEPSRLVPTLIVRGLRGERDRVVDGRSRNDALNVRSKVRASKQTRQLEAAQQIVQVQSRVWTAISTGVRDLVLDRRTLAAKDLIAPRYADLVYEGRWWTTEREAYDAFVNVTQQRVSGSELWLLDHKREVRSPTERLAHRVGVMPNHDSEGPG